jgi:adenylate kinase
VQAEFFLESYDIDGVINLEMPDSEVERRVLSRRLCSGCGLDYNLIASRPDVEDVCDVCGGTLVRRPDDNPEALAIRLRDYHDKTQPVIDLFERKEFVAHIDATQDREAVLADIAGEFHLPTD